MIGWNGVSIYVTDEVGKAIEKAKQKKTMIYVVAAAIIAVGIILFIRKK